MFVVCRDHILMTSPAAVEDAACDSDVLCLSFNQDCSSLSVGTNSGFTIRDTSSIKNFETIYDNKGVLKHIYILERLFSSSLIAIVSMTDTKTLRLCHFKKGTEICSKFYFKPILAVRLNRQRVVVVLEQRIYIHSITDMTDLHTISDTPLNPNGICAISNNCNTPFFAYPGDTVTGQVQIFDVTNLKAVLSIRAHNGPLAVLAFNPPGTKLATASTKGTVIRVYSIPEGHLLFELRRGLARYADISCLAFSADSNFLCVSSNTETVHIFKFADMPEKNMAVAEDNGSWIGYFTKAVSASVSYLPAQVSSVLTQERSFTSAKLPVAGLKNVCGIVTIQKVLYVIVAASNGYVYVYTLDGESEEKCELVRQHCVIPSSGSQCKSSGEDVSSEMNTEASLSTKDTPHVLFTNDTNHGDEIPLEADAG